MAMLAEKRSKQKWSEDPRNIAWSSGKIENVNHNSIFSMFVFVYVSIAYLCPH